MATSTPVSLEVYLKTSYQPDCDWIDGEVKERNMGEGAHVTVQNSIIFLFNLHRHEWGVRVMPEQRVQVAATRFRIPDVALASTSGPFEKRIVRIPPVLCVEVLSSEDRMSRIQERVADYLGMGVPMVWIVDPWKRKAFRSDASGLQQVLEELVVPGTNIQVTLAEVFADLDEFAKEDLEPHTNGDAVEEAALRLGRGDRGETRVRLGGATAKKG